jgi:AcrR family transcriptional regulator
MVARVVKDADERRQELLLTALELFNSRGYESTTVQAVTDAVGIAKGTFYHYFDSKEDLLDELVDFVSERAVLELRAQLATEEGGAVEKMRRLFTAGSEMKLRMRGFTAAVAQNLRGPQGALHISRIAQESGRRSKELIAEVVAEGMREGVFTVDDAQATAEVLVCLSLGIGVGTRALDTFAELPECPEKVEELIGFFRMVEQAMGRILGVADGFLRLYDYERMRQLFSDTCGTGMSGLEKGRQA